MSAENLWSGRRVRIVDGSSFSMPDTPENQEAYPQPSAQSPGCGFPVARFVTLTSWSTGNVLDADEDALSVHERTLFHRLWHRLMPGDVLLSDRGFCSYADLVTLNKRGVDAVMRLVQNRRVDFRKGRRLGPGDHLVTWPKPAIRPRWLSPEAFDALPEEITLREIRFRIHVAGFRSREITVVTTLLDPVAFPKEALAQLYRDRWFVELDLRHLKISMHMDVLRGKSPDIVRKEFWAHLLAYNLLRGLLADAADHKASVARRLSIKGSLQRLSVYVPQFISSAKESQDNQLTQLLRDIRNDPVPDRPDRVEPRARKRRPKPYPLLTVPRAIAREKIAS